MTTIQMVDGEQRAVDANGAVMDQVECPNGCGLVDPILHGCPYATGSLPPAMDLAATVETGARVASSKVMWFKCDHFEIAGDNIWVNPRVKDHIEAAHSS